MPVRIAGLSPGTTLASLPVHGSLAVLCLSALSAVEFALLVERALVAVSLLAVLAAGPIAPPAGVCCLAPVVLAFASLPAAVVTAPGSMALNASLSLLIAGVSILAPIAVAGVVLAPGAFAATCLRVVSVSVTAARPALTPGAPFLFPVVSASTPPVPTAGVVAATPRSRVA